MVKKRVSKVAVCCGATANLYGSLLIRKCQLTEKRFYITDRRNPETKAIYTYCDRTKTISLLWGRTTKKQNIKICKYIMVCMVKQFTYYNDCDIYADSISVF